MDYEALADRFEQAGIRSPYETDYDAWLAWRKANPGKDVMSAQFPAYAKLDLDLVTMPKGWELDVSKVLNERQLKRAEQASDESFAALPEPLRSFAGPLRRGTTFIAKPASLADLRPVRPYAPNGDCKLKLKLAEAVQIDYEQAAYADHSRFLIPVEGELGANRDACQRNLNKFCEAIRTHNGWAGSGCSWTMGLLENDAGQCAVYADCRASISD